MNRYWRITATSTPAGQVAELYLYGMISDQAAGVDDVTPGQLAEELKAVGEVSRITCHINSLGGSFFAGVAIYNMLKGHAAPVDVIVDGIAGSAASIIAMAGDTRRMALGSMLYLHNPMGMALGYAKDLHDFAAALEKMRGGLVSIYSKRTGLTAAKVGQMLDAETWLMAEEALKLKFATAVDDDNAVGASLVGNWLAVGGRSFDLTAAGIKAAGAGRAIARGGKRAFSRAAWPFGQTVASATERIPRRG